MRLANFVLVRWDESHFVCSVYRELDLLLLNMLCDPATLT